MNEQDIKVSHTGNKKLGKGISQFSRKTLVTCPAKCIHYENGCYATRVEKIYPNVARAYEHNMKVTTWQKLRSFFVMAQKRGNSVRLHVNGDFMKTDSIGRKSLDKKYLGEVLKAMSSISKKDRPKTWLYTHVHNKKILALESTGIKVYASIDSDDQYELAKKEGFKLFAFGSNTKKGKAQTKVESTPAGKTPICWEQLGTKESCEDCNYCIEGKGDIVFLKH